MMPRRLGAGLEDFDDEHTAVASGTVAFGCLRLIGSLDHPRVWTRGRVVLGQEMSSQSDVFGAVANGEQTIVTNTMLRASLPGNTVTTDRRGAACRHLAENWSNFQSAGDHSRDRMISLPETRLAASQPEAAGPS
ncbi:MAG: hypothetical protein ACR2Q4_13550 [Geminicoccaceae bacterium]